MGSQDDHATMQAYTPDSRPRGQSSPTLVRCTSGGAQIWYSRSFSGPLTLDFGEMGICKQYTFNKCQVRGSLQIYGW